MIMKIKKYNKQLQKLLHLEKKVSQKRRLYSIKNIWKKNKIKIKKVKWNCRRGKNLKKKILMKKKVMMMTIVQMKEKILIQFK